MRGFDKWLLNANCKLWLPLYEGVGSVVNSLDKAHSYGDITTAAWAAGSVGRALDFNAATPDYVVIPASFTQLNFIAQDFSIIVRCNADALAGDPYLLCRGLWATDGYALQVMATGLLRFSTNGASGGRLTDSAAGEVTTGSWFTLGVSRSGETVTLYKDGVDVTDSSGAHENPITCARSAKIGVYDNLSGGPFDGKMGFLGIWEECFTAQEMLTVHQYLTQRK